MFYQGVKIKYLVSIRVTVVEAQSLYFKTFRRNLRGYNEVY